MEWKTEQLGNLITIKYGKDHKKLKDGPFPVYGSGGIMRFVDTAIYNKPSLLLPRKGSLNNIMFTDKPFWTVDTMFWSIIDESKIEPKFLYYAMCKKNLVALNVGTSVPSLTVPVLEDVSIPYPPIPIQRKIAGILSALDSKIENNNKINANLEAQAEALFKSWFVDFTPFKDQPFVDSELGPIPQGWKVGKLGDYCECVLGGTPSRSESSYWNGDIAWINSGEVNKFRICTPSEFITSKGLDNSSTKLLPKKTTVLAITGATLGQISILEIDSCANQSVIGIKQNDNMPYEFIYPTVKVNIKRLLNLQTGGAQQHINKNNVQNLFIVYPPKFILQKYKEHTKCIYSKISTLCFENQRLAALRDTLLPKLMSGEIKL